MEGMEFHLKSTTSEGPISPDLLLSPYCSTLDDLFSAQHTEGDVSLDWLSVFVEDCLSSTGNCLPTPAPAPTHDNLQIKHLSSSSCLQKCVKPAAAGSNKARSKRKRRSSWCGQVIKKKKGEDDEEQMGLMMANSYDPPLIQQAYWLADSELIQLQDEEEDGRRNQPELKKEGDLVMGQQKQQPARRCSHCQSQRTPQWRAGPEGPKTLCNACGVRYKSGRLLPEYRPAKSPSFLTHKHSNSHKKVLEMRTTSLLSSSLLPFLHHH